MTTIYNWVVTKVDAMGEIDTIVKKPVLVDAMKEAEVTIEQVAGHADWIIELFSVSYDETSRRLICKVTHTIVLRDDYTYDDECFREQQHALDSRIGRGIHTKEKMPDVYREEFEKIIAPHYMLAQAQKQIAELHAALTDTEALLSLAYDSERKLNERITRLLASLDAERALH